jgi:hypothetical protein
MSLDYRKSSGFAWAELGLALAVIALVFQLVPSLWTGTLRAFNIANWSRIVWFAANCLVLFALIAIRFGPDLYTDWKKRRQRLSAARERKEKLQESQQQRLLRTRMKEALKRRVY